MAILDFIFRRKIKTVRYFDEKDRQFDMPSVSIQISKLDTSGTVKSQAGGYKSHNKITIPEGTDTTKLAQLDMVQYQLASSINTLNNKDKQDKTKEYVDILFQMFQLVSSRDSNSDVKKKFNDETKINNNSFSNLNKYLTDRSFQSTGLPNDLSTSDGYVIWPITLQPSATYIHTAQIQLIKLLVSAGWKLHVIIGDCGKHSATIKNPVNFKNSIENLLKKNEIKIEESTVTLLSRYFKRSPDDADKSLIQHATSLELLNTFHTVGNSVEWFNYWEYITKNYNKSKKGELKKRKVLSNLQPLLNWTVVITITNANNSHPKSIVLAGEDEKEQWDKITKSHGNNKIGMIYIQELQGQDKKTMDQSEISIGNETEMLHKLNNGNMGKWLYNHFVELPKFLTNQKPSFCKISDNECTTHNNNCITCLFGTNGKFNDANFDKNAFVNEIYKIANPANAN
jgi:hypothetical protein